jgi:DNA-binding IclR family transcriptional regulator
VPDNGRIEDVERYLVPGLQRGLEILRCFSRSRTQIGAPEMAKELRIPRSTVFRLVMTLEHMGFLERAPNGRDFRLGAAVLGLGFEYLASLEITELGRPVLEKLRNDTGFSSHLVIRDGRDVVFVLKAAAQSALTSSVTIGTRLPAHATVLGRIMLSYMREEELRALYPDRTLPQFTAKTPATLDDLKTFLAQDRARGYAVSEGFYERGISAIAAPVFDMSENVAAAINIVVPDGAAGSEQLHAGLARRVVSAAQDLSRQLNYRPARAALMP